MRYNNQHRHSCYSNVRSLDCVSKNMDYINRAIELGHDIVFSTEHGSNGNIYELTYQVKETNKKLGTKLKVASGCEFYYVDDMKEKDKKNYHLMVVALNNEGHRQINKAISISNVDGFYYRPRIDKEVLLNIFKPNDVVIMTACVAGILRADNSEELICELHDRFRDNFLLEVQNHNEESQKKHNKRILELSNKYGINIIHANDSHYIYPHESKYRQQFLKAKGINYPEESEFILDYPSYEEVVSRYEKQGILDSVQIEKALKNTLIFDKCQELDMINDDIKLPSISDDPNTELKNIISKEWNKVKKNIPKEKHKEYEEAIEFELDIIESTHMEDYFLLDYEIVKMAVDKYDGLLTKTGRGSAPSFYITKLLGMTEIDRLNAPVPLYPTRFMSKERILKAKSLPDIDLNAENPEPFIQATKDLLGEENCGWMVSYKPMQDASAFRLWCKSLDMKESEYGDIAKNIDDYREDSEWKEIIEDSKAFVGVIESISPSPCSMLLFNKPIDEEVGLVRTKDGICCNMDGINCDRYKYLKNDYLSVKVWKLIRETCKLANIEIPSIDELNVLLDNKTYGIYEKGLTCTINQADSEFGTGSAKEYKMKTVGEVSAFVAALRPGFASLLNNFLERKPYSTGIQALDELLDDSFHYLIYQESIMKYLIWLDIEESESYDIIKKIAKKKFKEQELNELKIKLHNNWIKRVGKEEGFNETWQVVEDASKYSFNASHSLSYAYDSLYGAYLKSHYPLEYYTATFNNYDGDSDRTTRLTKELEYFKIELKSPRFRKSRSNYFMDKKTNAIYKGISSIKYLNENIGEFLYTLKDNTYETFTELLVDIGKNINSKQMNILISLNFFEEFGKSKKLLDTYENFNNIYGKKQINKNKYPWLNNIFMKHTVKETASQFKFEDTVEMLKEIELNAENEDIPINELIKAQFEYMGSCNIIDKNRPRDCYVIDINTKYTPKALLFSVGSGNTQWVKVSKKVLKENPIEIGDMIYLYETSRKNKKKKVNDEWITLDESELWINKYWKVEV
ncbi:MAG: PHP domain-containing protein [Sarcina sp.]